MLQRTEEWGGYPGIDKRLFKDIWNKFGDGKSNSIELIDVLVSKILYQKIYGMSVVYPLNMVHYKKVDAENELKNKFGCNHFTNTMSLDLQDFMKIIGFLEGLVLKSEGHFSSLIMTGQMTREEALERISKPEMSEQFLNQEFEYVANKLDLTTDELKQLFELPKKYYHDYKNKKWVISLEQTLCDI